MNIIRSGSSYQIFNDKGFSSYTQLPIGTYDVKFSKMSGFFLTERQDLEVNENKIYGSTPDKIRKVLTSYNLAARNFGIILSGEKGSGKSLFARELCRQANMPVIVVNEYYASIGDFISSIEQEVIVLFDEFEKRFAETDDASPQEELLSLFDGLDNGKKLFVITCNDADDLNEYFINRPGRFHYHFKLDSLSIDEIKEYLIDNLLPEYQNSIDRITGMLYLINITYDILRAICFDLNQGYEFDETINDLNLSRNNYIDSLEMTLKTSNGNIYTGGYYIDFEDGLQYRTITQIDNRLAYCKVQFKTSDMKFTNKGILVPFDRVSYTFGMDDGSENIDKHSSIEEFIIYKKKNENSLLV